MTRYRVKAFTRREPEDRGYVGTKRTHHQLLQRRRWWGWQTIDREEVPSWARISLATVGDSGGWTSRFASLGSFGRDGVFTPHHGIAI